MPRRIDTPCNYPRCKNLSRKSYCPEHTRDTYLEQVEIRGTPAQRGYDARHRRWRRAVLARHPQCQMCLTEGRDRTATVADHIMPLDPMNPAAGNWSVEENGQGLCHACHNRKTANDQLRI